MIKLYVLKGKSDAYTLVKEIATEKFNSCEIIRDEHGKPYIKGAEGFYFNISHTDGITALAVSDNEVGADVEKIKAPDLRIAERRFLKSECDYIKAVDSDKRFFEVWTRKEAFLKFKGCGISGGLNSVDVFNCNPKIETFFINGYVISVCGEGEIQIIK